MLLRHFAGTREALADPTTLTLRDSFLTGCTPALTPVRCFAACTAALTVWPGLAALSARADTVLGKLFTGSAAYAGERRLLTDLAALTGVLLQVACTAALAVRGRLLTRDTRAETLLFSASWTTVAV